MSYAGAADSGPCEGRRAFPSNPTGAGNARTKEPLTETFVFRCSAAEKAQLRAKADAAGLPAATLLREALGLTEALIDASRHQWTYRAGVISFAATDAPTEEQQAEVMDHFERLAFAGLDPTQYEVLWVRHTHEDRVELHAWQQDQISVGLITSMVDALADAGFDLPRVGKAYLIRPRPRHRRALAFERRDFP